MKSIFWHKGQPSNTKSPEASPPPNGVPQSRKKFGFMGSAGEAPIAAQPATAKTIDTAGDDSTLSATAHSPERIGACPAQLKNPSLLPVEGCCRFK